jgi:aminodeoxyfutalosine synthase
MAGVDIEAVARIIATGSALTLAHVRELAASRDVIGLGLLAADARTRRHGTRGTFVRVETVDVAALADDTAVDVPAEAGEVRLVGTPVSLDAAVAAVRLVRAATTVPVSGWALDELDTWGAPRPDVLAALRAAGLDAVATARVDRCDLEAVRAVASAGLMLQSITLGTPAADDALIAYLEQVRMWQAATGVVRACAPLPVESSGDQPTTGFDDMRHVALARLVLDNVAHIQAHWGRMGAKLSQACLLFGADDIDAVPARDAMPHGPRRAILEEVRRNLVAASLDAVERDGGFADRRPWAHPVGPAAAGSQV